MLQTKLAPWVIAQSVRASIAPVILALEVTASYWQTWHAVFRVVR